MAVTQRSRSQTIILSPSSRFHQPSVSPTGQNHALYSPLIRSISTGIRHSVSASLPGQKPPLQRQTCLCSPTSHPGSYRCARHKKSGIGSGKTLMTPIRKFPVSNGLKLRRLAMKNSLARIGGVDGELAKKITAVPAKPSSSKDLRRRSEFQPQPSRFSVMCTDLGL